MEDKRGNLYDAVSNLTSIEAYLVAGDQGTLHVIDRVGEMTGIDRSGQGHTDSVGLTRCHEVYSSELPPYPYSLAGDDTLCELCGHESEFEAIQPMWIDQEMQKLDELVTPERNHQPLIVEAMQQVKLERVRKELEQSCAGWVDGEYALIAGVRVRLVIA